MIRKILITGGSGLLGQHLIRHLLESGDSVRAFVRTPNSGRSLPSGAEVTVGDITQPADVRAAVAGCDYVIHACSTHVYNLDPDKLWAVNVEGTKNICDAAQQFGCRRVVFTSSISTLTNSAKLDDSFSRMPARQRMSVSKVAGEKEVLERVLKGLPAVVINPSYFIGAFDYRPSPFRLWVPMAVRHPVRFVPGGGGFNVLGASDVARAHVWALDHGKIGCRYPLAGANISLLEYVTLINRAAGHDVVPAEVSSDLLRRFAIGKVFDEYAVDLMTRTHYVPEVNGIGGRTEMLADVICQTVRWFAENSNLVKLPSLAKYVWERYI